MTYSELIEFVKETRKEWTIDLFARVFKEAFTPEELALFIERLEV